MSIPDPEKVAARYSVVERRVWNDVEDLSPMPPSGQGLWIYLLTTPYAGVLPGLIVAGQAMLAEHLGWSVEAFRACFAELEARGMVRADWKARVVVLPKVLAKVFDRRKPDSPNVIKGWRAQWLEVPNSVLKSWYFDTLSTLVCRLGGAFAEAFVRAIPPPPPPSQPFRPPSAPPEAFAEDFGKGSADPFPIQDQDQEQDQEPHTSRVGARDVSVERAAGHSPEVVILIESLRASPTVVAAAAAAPLGPDLPLIRLAEMIEGRRIWAARSLELTVQSIGEAERDLGAKAAGEDIPTWGHVATTVAKYTDKSSRREAGEPQRAVWHAKQAMPEGAAHVATRWVGARQAAKLAPGEPAPRQCQDLWDLAERAADTAAETKAPGAWSPTAEEVVAFWIREYLRGEAPRAGSEVLEHYPLGLLVARCRDGWPIPKTIGQVRGTGGPKPIAQAIPKSDPSVAPTMTPEEYRAEAEKNRVAVEESLRATGNGGTGALIRRRTG